jgi:hypothetical protein
MELLMECIGQDIDEIRKQRIHFQDLHALSPDMWPPPQTAFGVKKCMQLALKDKAWIFFWMAVVITSVMIIRLIGLGQEPAQAISDSLIRAEQQITASSTAELQVIGDAAQVLETLPRPAAGQISREVSVEKKPQQASVGKTTDPQDMNEIAAVTTTASASLRIHDKAVPKVPASTTLGIDSVEGGQSSAREHLHTAASVDKEGTWIINLVSLSRKADADRFAEKAQSKDIETKQQHVAVKGKQYWRVQIAGFSTAVEAKVYSVTAIEKLGLNDVWITTR